MKTMPAASHAIAISRTLSAEDDLLYLMANAYWEPLDFHLPAANGLDQRTWRLAVDTSQPAPDDIHASQDMPLLDGTRCRVGPRAVVALVAASTT